MLEELQVPYTYHPINIRQGEQHNPAFVKLSPNHKTPAIVDPEGPGGAPISIFESGAILKYLGQKFGKFYPRDPYQQAKIDQWVFWQVGGFGPMLGQAEHYARFPDTKIPYAINRFNDEAHRLFKVLDTQLEGSEYIVGEVSIADFMIIAWSNTYEDYGIKLADFPSFAAWNQRMNARPHTRRGIEALVV